MKILPEIASVTTQFSADVPQRKIEIDKEKAEFIEKGNEEAAFAAQSDEVEDKFKETLNSIKEKKAALLGLEQDHLLSLQEYEAERRARTIQPRQKQRTM